MKLLTKLIIFASIVTPISASAITYAVLQNRIDDTIDASVSTDGDDYVVTSGDYSLRLNKETLKFSVTKGEKTWKSDTVETEPPYSATEYRRSFFESPATIYSYSSTGGEGSFSVYDPDHFEVTTSRITVDGSKLMARISTLDGRKSSPNIQVSFTINYELVKDGLRLSVTDIEQSEKSQNALSKIIIYPGFGMSKDLVNEKFLIPDGSGAIIDLSKPTHAQSALALRTYGQDIGITLPTRTSYSSEQLSMPMYSIFNGDQTTITTVEGGQEYSELNAKVAGMTDCYNAVYFRFIYKEITYQYLGVNEDNKKAVPQETTNQFTPILHYHLFDEKMDYFDVAKKYQEYLIENKLLKDQKYGDSNVRLEFLMAENKKALIGNELVKMTSTSFIKNAVEGLLENGNDYSVSLKGYTKGGFGGSYPYSFPVEGSTGDYKNLGNYLKDKGIAMNFNVDLVRSFKSEINKSAENMSQKMISTVDYVNGTDVKFYRATPNNTANLLKKYEANLDKYNASGFDFTSIGYELFSTYYHEKHDRTDSIAVYQQAMANYSHQANVRKPNLYLYNYFDNYLDAPRSSSGFMIETESIPFLQMVLSGYKSFYCSPINLNYLGKKQLLELVDYNINPSFLLTEEDTMKLINSSASSYIYTSKFDLWKNDIVTSYSEVVSKLKQVEANKFISREKLASGVYKNVYESGKIIIVNYSVSPYDYNGTMVPSLTCEVF